MKEWILISIYLSFVDKVDEIVIFRLNVKAISILTNLPSIVVIHNLFLILLS